MSVRNQLIKIYNSRLHILNILESVYGYDIKDYSGFSINEIDAMISNDQLDMLLTHKKSGENLIPINKTYIKYFMNGTLNSSSISVMIEDLFTLTDTLNKDDCLCIIYEGEPNDSLLTYLNYIYNQSNLFIVVHNLKRLQFNILEHNLVPKVSILTDAQFEDLKKQYTIESTKQLPEIKRFDPVALAICLRPGQVCKFLRNSPTSMTSPYYRVCI